VISFAIMAFNLLPLPVLDGGHVFLAAVEAIRRRPPSEWFTMVYQRVGLVLIGSFFVFVLYNDLSRSLQHRAAVQRNNHAPQGEVSPARARRGGLALAALALCCCPDAPAPSTSSFSALKRVQKVVIQGNHSIKEGAIKKVIKTGLAFGCSRRSTARLPAHRRDHHSTLYPARASCSPASAAGDWRRAWGADRDLPHRRGPAGPRHGCPVRQHGRCCPRLHGAIHLKAGEPYDPVQAVLDRTAVAEAFADRGYFRPSPRRRSSPRQLGWRSTSIVPAGVPGARVQITGVSEVDTAGVRRSCCSSRRPVPARALIKSTERLYETGLFTSAEIEPVRADTLLGQVDLNARVRERRAGSRAAFGPVVREVRRLGGVGPSQPERTGRSITADGSGFYQAKDPYLDRCVSRSPTASRGCSVACAARSCRRTSAGLRSSARAPTRSGPGCCRSSSPATSRTRSRACR
jgi:hypothetical protein